jgi:DNA polymerase III delta subunit
MIRVVVGAQVQGEELRWETTPVEEVATLASTASLLGDTRVFVLSGALSGEQADEFFDLVPGLVRSPHTFIFVEESLLKKQIDRLAKQGVVAEVSPKQAPTEEPFSIFALANTFATRDRKKLWLLFAEARRKEVAPEAVAGMLHWKVRDLLAKGGGKYQKSELVQLSRQLVAMYHDAHRGLGTLDLLLERFILRL